MSRDDFDDTDDLTFSLEQYAQLVEADDGLLDTLHALKYGEGPPTLGWAWRDAEALAPSTVRINCVEYTFDPLTRELVRQ